MLHPYYVTPLNPTSIGKRTIVRGSLAELNSTEEVSDCWNLARDTAQSSKFLVRGFSLVILFENGDTLPVADIGGRVFESFLLAGYDDSGLVLRKLR